MTTGVGVQPEHVERAFLLLERGPITAVAAFFVTAFFALLFLHLRTTRRHQTEMAALYREHAERAERAWGEERARAIRLELVAHNLCELAEELERLPKRRPRPQLSKPEDPNGN